MCQRLCTGSSTSNCSSREVCYRDIIHTDQVLQSLYTLHEIFLEITFLSIVPDVIVPETKRWSLRVDSGNLCNIYSSGGKDSVVCGPSPTGPKDQDGEEGTRLGTCPFGEWYRRSK